VNFRPEYRADWTHHSYYEQLALRPLDAGPIEEMLGEWLGSDPSVAGLSARIRERTAGNPFFIEELVQSLIESQVLVGARGAYRMARAVDEIEIPATVQSLLAARMDRLAGREKQLLQTASVLGKEFAEGLIERVSELAPSELHEALRALVNAEFLYEQTLYPEVEYSFKHPLTQEVAYGSQLREQRRRVHDRAAKALEQLHADALDEKAALLAHHWEAAGEALAAALWHRRAAQWMRGRHAAATAEHLERVRELLEGAPESAETLTLRLEATAQLMLSAVRVRGRSEDVDRLRAEGMELARRSGDERGRAVLLTAYHYPAVYERANPEDIEGLEQACEIADRLGDRGLQISARWPLLIASFFGGRRPLTESAALIEQFLELAEGDWTRGSEVTGFSPCIQAVGFRGLLAAAQGDPQSARREIERSLELARQHEDLLALNAIHGTYVNIIVDEELLEPEQASLHAQRALEYAERCGSVPGLLIGRWAMAWAQHRNGNHRKAASGLEEAIAMAERERFFVIGSTLRACQLVEAYLAMDDPKARPTLEQALSRRLTSWDSPYIDLVHARVLLKEEGAKAREEIEDALMHGTVMMETSGAVGLEPGFRTARAELAQLVGDAASAEREIRQAHRIYRERGQTRAAERLEREWPL
jgi:hypothetical protein